MKTFKNIIVVALVFIQSVVFSQTESKIKVYAFLSETCPISQYYTAKLKQLDTIYRKSVDIIGVFSNHFSNENSIYDFKGTYSIPFSLVKDEGGALAKKFDANITPEVFVVDKTGKVIYSGRIDDSYMAINKKRDLTGTNELEDVLKMAASGQEVNVAKTKAVGCLITIKK